MLKYLFYYQVDVLDLESKKILFSLKPEDEKSTGMK